MTIGLRSTRQTRHLDGLLWIWTGFDGRVKVKKDGLNLMKNKENDGSLRNKDGLSYIFYQTNPSRRQLIIIVPFVSRNTVQTRITSTRRTRQSMLCVDNIWLLLVWPNNSHAIDDLLSVLVWLISPIHRRGDWAVISGFDTIVIITDKLNSILNAAILIDFEFDVVRCRLYRDACSRVAVLTCFIPCLLLNFIFCRGWKVYFACAWLP